VRGLLAYRHPAHVFTDEDRRKAAAVTNQIRHERAEILALELENRVLERRLAVVEARRQRKREYARQRWERLRAEAEEARRSSGGCPGMVRTRLPGADHLTLT
jgi:hypothetical protein